MLQMNEEKTPCRGTPLQNVFLFVGDKKKSCAKRYLITSACIQAIKDALNVLRVIKNSALNGVKNGSLKMLLGRILLFCNPI